MSLWLLSDFPRENAALQQEALCFLRKIVFFNSESKLIMLQLRNDFAPNAAPGCGPLIPPLSESSRPLRQQIFERVRAAGSIARVQVAKELGVSPASVTTGVSELIALDLLEEVVAPRDGDAGRGRPAVALGVRAGAHRVAGIKLSDREHTAVIVDFAGNLIANEAIPRSPGAMELPQLLEAMANLLDKVCAKAGIERSALSALAGVCRQQHRAGDVVIGDGRAGRGLGRCRPRPSGLARACGQ